MIQRTNTLSALPPYVQSWAEIYKELLEQGKVFNGNAQQISVGKAKGFIAVGFASGGVEGETVTLKNWPKKLPPLNGPAGTRFPSNGIAGQFMDTTLFFFNVGSLGPLPVKPLSLELSFEMKNRQGRNETHDLTIKVGPDGCTM